MKKEQYDADEEKFFWADHAKEMGRTFDYVTDHTLDGWEAWVQEKHPDAKVFHNERCEIVLAGVAGTDRAVLVKTTAPDSFIEDELIFGLKGRNYTDEAWTEKATSEGYYWEVIDESADGPQFLMDNHSAILMWV